MTTLDAYRALKDRAKNAPVLTYAHASGATLTVTMVDDDTPLVSVPDKSVRAMRGTADDLVPFLGLMTQGGKPFAWLALHGWELEKR